MIKGNQKTVVIEKDKLGIIVDSYMNPELTIVTIEQPHPFRENEIQRVSLTLEQLRMIMLVV